MKIGILGASGRIWQALIQEALWRKHDIIALVRDHKKLQHYQDQITIIQWDATNSNDIKKILSQVDVVIHVVSVPLFHKKPTTLYSQTTQALISARWDHQCKKLIVMSNTWTQHGRHLPWPTNIAYERLLGDVANDKEKEENLLEKSGLPWTIIKSPILTNGKQGTYRLQNFDNYQPTLLSFISRKTVAKVIVDIAEHDTYLHQKIVPHSSISFN
jgi:putative NADH-flavin reductase